MIIAIRKETNNSIYIDKTALNRFSEEILRKPPYNFSFISVDFEDVEPSDFDLDLKFNIEKYNQRKSSKEKQLRIVEIKTRLNKLSQDFIQAQVGAVFDDLDQRKAEFKALHNELRGLLGKAPRKYERGTVYEN